ncbi:MAG: hypothetical protein CL398_12705, partial [Acidiferrobacteraceae bacterium]|nr:hypothetical protein [Acidiferrobacteraceae bacterium]
MYPWLTTHFEQLSALNNELPSKLLLLADTGTGKSFLAYELARNLLCPNKNNEPSKTDCDCNSCTLFRSHNHPDYHVLTTEAVLAKEETEHMSGGMRYIPDDRRKRSKGHPREIISIDQVRPLVDEIRAGANLGFGKVVTISPAESLNTNAANALLKVLEEPPSETYFLITANSSHSLAPTILSRCACYRLHITNDHAIVDWLVARLSCSRSHAQELLKYTGGSPFEALEAGQYTNIVGDSSFKSDLAALVTGVLSPMEASKRWLDSPVRITLKWLQRSMLATVKAGIEGSNVQDLTTIYRVLGPDGCIAVYQEAGEYLQWPPRSVDEELF